MFLLITLSVLHYINGEVVVPGNCPQIPPIENFHTNEALGTWYMITRYPNRIDNDTRCMSVINYLGENGHFCAVFSGNIITDNARIQIVLRNELSNASSGFIRYVGFKNEDHFTWPFYITKLNSNYAILWYCEQNGANFSANSWIFGRRRTLSPELLAEALKVCEDYGIPTTYFQEMDQTNCSASKNAI